MSLSDQVAWVTGAGRGIGRAVALELAARGAKVLVSGRSERALGEAVGEIVYQRGVARFQVADVRDPLACETAARRAFELWGRLDVVVACAGVGGSTRLDDDDPRPAVEVIETNLIGTMLTFRAATRVMAGPGRLIALSSVLGKQGASGKAAYCASKAGVLGLVRAAALELGPRRITANAVCPGWVDTEMGEQSMSQLAASRGVTVEQAKLEELGRTALGRFIEPGEVARLVAFLAGPDAEAITGQALSICGGGAAFGA